MLLIVNTIVHLTLFDHLCLVAEMTCLIPVVLIDNEELVLPCERCTVHRSPYHLDMYNVYNSVMHIFK